MEYSLHPYTSRVCRRQLILSLTIFIENCINCLPKYVYYENIGRDLSNDAYLISYTPIPPFQIISRFDFISTSNLLCIWTQCMSKYKANSIYQKSQNDL